MRFLTAPVWSVPLILRSTISRFRTVKLPLKTARRFLCGHAKFNMSGLTQIQHAARDFFIFNPLNPLTPLIRGERQGEFFPLIFSPCQGSYREIVKGVIGRLMNQMRKSYMCRSCALQ